MNDVIWPPKSPASPDGPKNKPQEPDTEPSLPQPTTEVKNSVKFNAIRSTGPERTKIEMPTTAAKPKRFATLRLWHSNLSRKQKVLFSLIIALLIFGGGIAIYAVYKQVYKAPPTSTSVAKSKAKEVPKPTTETSNLTGVEVAIGTNKRPVTGIMIENSPDARPQSGIKDAGVVYEAIAEGGITRFLTLFQEAQPDYIGPVRSVRPYYLDFLMPYDAAIAHVGGAPQALSDIKSLGVKDLDQFYNSAAYQRITQRYAPHNVYTSFAKLDALNASKGFTTSNFTGFVRKKEAASTTPTAKTIDFAISGPLYNAHFDYDATTNSYKRSEGGKPHIDEKSGVQLSPKVVIALVMSRGIAGDGQHTNYGTVGSGHMYVFQDGIVTEGTWAKTDRKAQFTFTDSNGATLKLNPGQTWISLVDAPSNVVYKP